MRLYAYAGASTALAAGVVIYAFNQRANFYSACVYLAQSNLCLMILTNLILFLIASVMFGLQRTFYGPLRPIEIEQLYEKAWFAITETCLAMTIFREEVGAWFLVMFVALLIGKVWGWIGEGRVEVLEQQPPANPRLFHIRLSFSLAISVIYDMWIMAYTISTVIQQARPNMMVMFLFEFAVLTTSSYSTALRYVISIVETKIVQTQTQERLEARRREVREERAEILRQREVASTSGEPSTSNEGLPPLPSEDDVDEIDIEVPGWEAKGQWVLTLDLVTDFVKLGIYAVFFFVLLKFYGLPLHILRDLFVTARSFAKRLTAFIKYRNATRDMNKRYPDATVEEIQREDTCIICREEMKPWSVTNPELPPAPANGVAAAGPPAPRNTANSPSNERSRPKKLPCGHVLHLGCLKSWLERQQVCPTCRRPVIESNQIRAANAQRQGQPPQAPVPGQLPLPEGGLAGQAPAPPPQGGLGGMINIGPLRFNFGRGQVNLGGGQPGQPNAAPANARAYGLELGFPPLQPHQPVQPQTDGATPPTNGPALPIQVQLQVIEQQIRLEIQNLHVAHAELGLVRDLQAELVRLRAIHDAQHTEIARTITRINAPMPATLPATLPPFGPPAVRLHRHAPLDGTSAIPSGSSDLPPGVTIPEGWSLLPLQNVDTLLAQQQNIAQQNTVQSGIVPSRVFQTHIQPGNFPQGPVSLVPPSRSQNVTPVASQLLFPRPVPLMSSGQFPPSTGANASDSGDSNGTTRGADHPQLDAVNMGGAGPAVEPQLPSSNSTMEPHSSQPPTSWLPKPETPSSTAAEPVAEALSTQTDGESSQDKGKAKAATVEDMNEDE